jgi:hypothetical protein
MPGKQKKEDTLACGTKLFATLDKKFNCGSKPQADVSNGRLSIRLKTARSPELFSEWSAST